jgi:predicted transcriptional regulator
MVSDSAVLMSIRPAYADAILNGTKTVELRRRRPSFPPGTPVLIYSSSPDQRVTGTFDVGRVLAAPPSSLWRRVSGRAGVPRDLFDAYFAGCETAYAIEVLRPRRLRPTELPLRPPQSYLILRRGDPRHADLLRLAAGERRKRKPASPNTSQSVAAHLLHKVGRAAAAVPIPRRSPADATAPP